MNVVIVGGGQKFGKIIADKFRDEGNSVYILSHRNYGQKPNHFFANFLDVDDVVLNFKQLISNIDHIDLLLYNTNADYGPYFEQDFHSDANLQQIADAWNKTISIQAILPHLLSVAALGRMSKDSKIVFMTSGLAFGVPRDFCTSSVGHPGGKAAQTHLMFALANHNDKDAIVYSISTHFEYEDKEKLNHIIDKIFNNLKTVDSDMTGRIIKFWN